MKKTIKKISDSGFMPILVLAIGIAIFYPLISLAAKRGNEVGFERSLAIQMEKEEFGWGALKQAGQIGGEEVQIEILHIPANTSESVRYFYPQGVVYGAVTLTAIILGSCFFVIMFIIVASDPTTIGGIFLLSIIAAIIGVVSIGEKSEDLKQRAYLEVTHGNARYAKKLQRLQSQLQKAPESRKFTFNSDPFEGTRIRTKEEAIDFLEVKIASIQ